MFADEEGIEAGSAQANKIVVRAQAGFADRDTRIGNLVDELEGSFRAHGERLQVAVVYANDAGVCGQRAVELACGVNFDERLHAEFAAEASRARASPTASKGSRRTPRDGDAGFSSARMLIPSRESAAAKSRSGVAAFAPYFRAVSGRTFLR